jgi:isopenicillin-N epimerase
MSNIRDQFLFNPDIHYLNHGSFGACPKPVFEDYQKWQLALERDPVQFMTRTGREALNRSKAALSKFIGCHQDDIVMVTNPSYAGGIIIKGLKLEPGDEILTTNQEYGAMDKAWNYVCRKSGAKYVRQEIQLPIATKESFIEQFWKGRTSRTKIVFISHITSPTGLVFPVEEICARAKELGLMTFVDGAHAPGQVPLDLSTLNADIYTGACHKWLLTPKGCSFLYVRRELQDQFDPLIISWGYEAEFPSHSKFLDYHEQQGTRDFSAFLTVPAALKFRADNNWEAQTKICRDKIRHYYPLLCKAMGTSPICPLDSGFLAQMASIPTKTKDPYGLKDLFYDQYAIEIPVMKCGDRTFTRISIQPYTSERDIESLMEAIKDIRAKGGWILE